MRNFDVSFRTKYGNWDKERAIKDLFAIAKEKNITEGLLIVFLKDMKIMIFVLKYIGKRRKRIFRRL